MITVRLYYAYQSRAFHMTMDALLYLKRHIKANKNSFASILHVYLRIAYTFNGQETINMDMQRNINIRLGVRC